MFPIAKSGRTRVPEEPDLIVASVLSYHRQDNKCYSLKETMSKAKLRLLFPNFAKDRIDRIIRDHCAYCADYSKVDVDKAILVRWSDGLLYKGYIISIKDKMCLVEMENTERAVVHIKDIHNKFKFDVLCVVCSTGKSVPPNEIVLCDFCNLGFHQRCHVPVISDETLQAEGDWFCSQCDKARPSAVNIPRPQFTQATLACMALIVLGPSSITSIVNWIQKTFPEYACIRGDRWKSRLNLILSVTRLWVVFEEPTWRLRTDRSSLYKYLQQLRLDGKGLPASVSKKITGPIPSSPSVNISLPYDLSSLTWDAEHRTNKEHIYCYCGGYGHWDRQMLTCATCRQWFHQACVTALDRALLCGERCWFVCSVCNGGQEAVSRCRMSMVTALHLAMYHLTVLRGGERRPICLKKEVLPILQTLNPNAGLTELVITAQGNKNLFKSRRENMFELMDPAPPRMELRPVSASSSPQPLMPTHLPGGFTVSLRNHSLGLQVDGSPGDMKAAPFQLEEMATAERAKPAKKSKAAAGSSSVGGEPAVKKAKTTPKQVVDLTVESSGQLKVGREDDMVVRRIESGERYKVVATRVNADGKVETLIAWEGFQVPNF